MMTLSPFRRFLILSAMVIFLLGLSACKSNRITLALKAECNPFATSEVCVFPFPSSFFQKKDANSVTGVRMSYPQSVIWIDPGVPQIDVAPTNTADGCSPAGPLLVHFARDIAAEHLNGQRALAQSLTTGNPIALFDLDTGKRVLFMSEMDMNRDPNFPNRYALIIRPMEPMEMGHRHVAVLTRDLRDDQGNPLPSPEAFRVLRDKVLTNNDVLEAVRDRYERIFAFLDSKGYQRNQLLLAWDFMVASESYLTGSVLSMRREALAEMTGTGLGYQLTKVTDDPNAHTARLVEGTFEVPTYLNAKSAFSYDENHHPIRQPANLSFPFAMVIPKKARTLGQPLPLVVFGHGLFGSGVSYLAGWGLNRFSEYAERSGSILIGTDWIGLSEGDLNLILTEVVPDLNNITLITDRLQQSLINNLTLTELALGKLSSAPELKVGTNELIDANRIYYYGVSLGGIQGSSFVSLSPRITRAVLAVPGCGWLNMLTRSVHWNLIAIVANSYYPDPLLRQIGIALIQARFDLSDPVNLTRHLFKAPLMDTPPGRVVLLQESIGDSQVPNLATDMLARAMGVKVLLPSVYDITGLETTTAPTTESVIEQYYMVDQARAAFPPDSNVPPEDDNKVHSDILGYPHVLDQTFHFLSTGEVKRTCSGLCDPD